MTDMSNETRTALRGARAEYRLAYSQKYLTTRSTLAGIGTRIGCPVALALTLDRLLCDHESAVRLACGE